jgi:hypothetical protein
MMSVLAAKSGFLPQPCHRAVLRVGRDVWCNTFGRKFDRKCWATLICICKYNPKLVERLVG